MSTTSKRVTYRKVKALLRVDYERTLLIDPPRDLKFHRITLTTDGLLIIEKGYAWDHASGALDTETIVEGALVHDALCELMHNHFLPKTYWDRAADIMYDINISNGMFKWRAAYIRKAIKMAGPKVTQARKWIVV